MTKPETPMLTVDMLIEVVDETTGEDSLVFIERKNTPFGWALPGGCVDVGESCQDAAIREALEETCLNIEDVVEAGMYDAPDRDPRGHAVSIAYYATAKGTPIAADDAADVKLISIRDLQQDCVLLCFDHETIVKDFLVWRKTHRVPKAQLKRDAFWGKVCMSGNCQVYTKDYYCASCQEHVDALNNTDTSVRERAYLKGNIKEMKLLMRKYPDIN
jgi:8-oxo-dGTP diphosphatase